MPEVVIEARTLENAEKVLQHVIESGIREQHTSLRGDSAALIQSEEFLYLVVSECPACDAEVGHAERFDGPVALDHHVPLSAKYCPQCGVEIAECEFGWTPVEEAEVARVLPTQEREEVSPDA
jgi:Fe-S oxidoreductase